MKERLASAVLARLDHLDAPCLRILAQPVLERASRRAYLSLHDRPVDFLDGSLPELLGEAGGRLARPREQQHARGRLVDAMHDAKEDVPRLLILLPEVFLDGAVEG